MLASAQGSDTRCCWGARSSWSLAQNAQRPLSPDCTTAPLPPGSSAMAPRCGWSPVSQAGSLCLLPTSPWSSNSSSLKDSSLSRFQPPGQYWVAGWDLDVPFHPGVDVTPAVPGLRPWRLPARSPGPLPGTGRQSPQRVNRKVGRASSQGNGPCSCSYSRKLLNCIENVSLGPRTCHLIGHQGSGLGGREGGDWACGPPALLLPSAPTPGSPGWGWGPSCTGSVF